MYVGRNVSDGIFFRLWVTWILFSFEGHVFLMFSWNYLAQHLKKRLMPCKPRFSLIIAVWILNGFCWFSYRMRFEILSVPRNLLLLLKYFLKISLDHGLSYVFITAMIWVFPHEILAVMFCKLSWSRLWEALKTIKQNIDWCSANHQERRKKNIFTDGKKISQQKSRVEVESIFLPLNKPNPL